MYIKFQNFNLKNYVQITYCKQQSNSWLHHKHNKYHHKYLPCT